MSPTDAHRYVLLLYQNLLKREPAPLELEHWVTVTRGETSAENIFYAFIRSEEYKLKNSVASIFPSGHYYSAIVDPSTVSEYVQRERQTDPDSISGIDVPLRRMEEFWQRSSSVIAETPFHELQNEHHRFYYDNNIFPYGDAITLRAMIADLKPHNIIEIGSGFSSACMLDCADEFGLDTEFTFIDPYPERLKRLLNLNDGRRVTIVELPVQKTDIRLYSSLGPGDILFIDSTHVLKTGSDVHYELFHILPTLRKGVIVHFHDIQFPFEYPDQWIFRNNHSWNEIYALRAFLMYNTNFRIRFWGSCFAKVRTKTVSEVFPLFLKNPGGSLWIERI